MTRPAQITKCYEDTDSLSAFLGEDLDRVRSRVEQELLDKGRAVREAWASAAPESEEDYEVPSVTAAYARWRFEKLGLPVPVLTEIPLGQQFDAIYCTEVLEHVPKPTEAMRELGFELARLVQIPENQFYAFRRISSSAGRA